MLWVSRWFRIHGRTWMERRDKGFSCGPVGEIRHISRAANPLSSGAAGDGDTSPGCTGGTRVFISCHLLRRSLERMSRRVGTLGGARVPLWMPLRLDHPFVVSELGFRENIRLDFRGALIVFTRRRNPLKMLLGSCHGTAGSLVPRGSNVCEVTHFSECTFVWWALCSSIQTPPLPETSCWGCGF